jgi:hypothetical protein
MVNGKWLDNTTCKHCRHRHPPSLTCEQARKAMEANRAARPEPFNFGRAYEVCEGVDAALFSGDVFEDALPVLEDYLTRWWREIQRRAPSQLLPTQDLIHRRLGTLVALLRSGKIVRGGLTPEEMRQWAAQIYNIIKGPAPKAAEEKDPLLL